MLKEYCEQRPVGEDGKEAKRGRGEKVKVKSNQVKRDFRESPFRWNLSCCNLDNLLTHRYY